MPDLKRAAHVLAMLALQSNRYRDDPEYRDAVDNVLAHTLPPRKELHHAP